MQQARVRFSVALAAALAVATVEAGEALAQSASGAPDGADAGASSDASTASTTTTTTTTTSQSPTAGTQGASAATSPSTPASGPSTTSGQSGATSASTAGATTTSYGGGTTAGASSTRATAPSAEPRHEDDGRSIDFIFVQGEGGLSYIDLTALGMSGRLLPTLTQFRGTGYGGGLTVGFRSSVIAVAAHGYLSRFDGQGENRAILSDPTSPTTTTQAGFDIGQLMAEVQLRIPVPFIEPYARVGFGYAWMGSFQLNDMYRDSTSTVHGWTGKLGMGLDLWLGRYVTVGAGVDVSVLNLRRGGVMRANSACPSSNPTCVELTMDGDGVALLAHFHAQAGIHF
jgi:hypothetical protein